MNRNEDLSENLSYTSPELPILTSFEDMSDLPTRRELIHWHDDFEFILVTLGSIDFYVNGKTIHLKQNQGIFINSGRLHYGFTESMDDVNFKLVIISPELARNAYNSRIIEDLNSTHNADYLRFHSNRLIWSVLDQICNINKKHEENYLLELQSEICLLIKELSALCTDTDRNESSDVAAIKKMLYFLQEHFSEKISVADIAAAGFISRNQCFKLFQQTMHMTPQQYLMQYRIDKSIDMMRAGISIAETAHSCGFCSQSHYTKAFKVLYGMTPKQYLVNMK